MLVVRVEIWPGGHSDRRREIGLLALANVSDLDAESDYVVIRSVGQHVDARVVRKHPRASGFWPLIARAASSRASTRVTESEREIARMMEGRVKPPNDHRR